MRAAYFVPFLVAPPGAFFRSDTHQFLSIRHYVAKSCVSSIFCEDIFHLRGQPCKFSFWEIRGFLACDPAFNCPEGSSLFREKRAQILKKLGMYGDPAVAENGKPAGVLLVFFAAQPKPPAQGLRQETLTVNWGKHKI